MKVRQLIKQLESLDQDALIVLSGSDHNYRESYYGAGEIQAEKVGLELIEIGKWDGDKPVPVFGGEIVTVVIIND